MPQNIAWLPELALLEQCNGDWGSYLNTIYEYFLSDFVRKQSSFKGIKIAIKRHPLIDGKEATFWHLISEGSREDQRTPDIRRCERIRWPSPIIHHCSEQHIKIWFNRRKGETRVCLWLESEEYLVVLAERNNYLLLWTAYLVTRNHQKRKLEAEYIEYKKAEAAQGLS